MSVILLGPWGLQKIPCDKCEHAIACSAKCKFQDRCLISPKYLNDVLTELSKSISIDSLRFKQLNKKHPRNLNNTKRVNNMILLISLLTEHGLYEKIVDPWETVEKMSRVQIEAITPAAKRKLPSKIAASKVKITPSVNNIPLPHEDELETIRRAL